MMQRLTTGLVDQFIADLKDSVREAKLSPSGSGSMVTVYGEHTFLASLSFFPFLMRNVASCFAFFISYSLHLVLPHHHHLRVPAVRTSEAALTRCLILDPRTLPHLLSVKEIHQNIL